MAGVAAAAGWTRAIPFFPCGGLLFGSEGSPAPASDPGSMRVGGPAVEEPPELAAATGPAGLVPDATIDAGVVRRHAAAASPGDRRATDAAPPGAGGGGVRAGTALAIPTDGRRALKTRLSTIWAFVPKRASLSLVKHGSRNEVPLAR